MKKAQSKDPDVLPEYDFSQGTRGKYARRYAEGSNVVVLDPDVVELFPDAESVNRTLRSVGRLIEEHSQKARRPSAKKKAP